MLQLSQSAADVLHQARDEQDIHADYGVRVSAQAGPGGQTSVTVGFAEAPAEGDQVTEEAGMELYVSQGSPDRSPRA